MNIDHVVLWVDNPKESLNFYVDVMGMTPVRAQEFEQGAVPFPSVRIDEMTILDLMSKTSAPGVQKFTGGGDDSAGHAINHLCLSMAASEYAALTTRLEAAGVELTSGGERSFGAQGVAEVSNYLSDPDGNVIEIRHYPAG